MNRNNGFLAARKLRKHVAVCVLADCNGNLDSLFEPIVFLEPSELFFVFVSRFAVRKQEDCRRKRARNIAHKRIAGQLFVQHFAHFAEIGKPVRIEVVPAKAFRIDGGGGYPVRTA